MDKDDGYIPPKLRFQVKLYKHWKGVRRVGCELAYIDPEFYLEVQLYKYCLLIGFVYCHER